MVRFGVIGYGNMGSKHSESIAGGIIPDAVLSAVCDTNPQALARASKAHPDVKTFSDPQDLFAANCIDAVIVATPHYDHPPLAMKAFDAGVHVLIEKPAGVYTKAVRQMNEASLKCNVVFAQMYNQRTDPLYIKMREMVAGGQLGTLKRTSWIVTDWYRPQAYYDSGDWRATWNGEGGGVLINQCPHNLDLWQWIVGMPTRVFAHVHHGKWHNIEVEDDVTAYVEYENGATGTFVTSTADSPGTNRFEVLGDLGKLVCEKKTLTHYALDMGEREFNRTTTKAFSQPSQTRTVVDCSGDYPQHPGVIAAFTRKILGKGELIACGREGINGLMISNAIHLSGWLGRMVDLPIDEDLFLHELNERRGVK